MSDDYTVEWYRRLQTLRQLAGVRMIVLFGFYVAAVVVVSPQEWPAFLAPYGFYMISAFAAGIQLANQWPTPSWYSKKPKQSDAAHRGLVTSIGLASLTAFLTSLCVTARIATDTFHVYYEVPTTSTAKDLDLHWMIAMTVAGLVVTLLDALCFIIYIVSTRRNGTSHS